MPRIIRSKSTQPSAPLSCNSNPTATTPTDTSTKQPLRHITVTSGLAWSREDDEHSYMNLKQFNPSSSWSASIPDQRESDSSNAVMVHNDSDLNPALLSSSPSMYPSTHSLVDSNSTTATLLVSDFDPSLEKSLPLIQPCIDEDANSAPPPPPTTTTSSFVPPSTRLVAIVPTPIRVTCLSPTPLKFVDAPTTESTDLTPFTSPLFHNSHSLTQTLSATVPLSQAVLPTLVCPSLSISTSASTAVLECAPSTVVAPPPKSLRCGVSAKMISQLLSNQLNEVEEEKPLESNVDERMAPTTSIHYSASTNAHPSDGIILIRPSVTSTVKDEGGEPEVEQVDDEPFCDQADLLEDNNDESDAISSGNEEAMDFEDDPLDDHSHVTNSAPDVSRRSTSTPTPSIRSSSTCPPSALSSRKLVHSPYRKRTPSKSATRTPVRTPQRSPSVPVSSLSALSTPKSAIDHTPTKSSLDSLTVSPIQPIPPIRQQMDPSTASMSSSSSSTRSNKFRSFLSSHRPAEKVVKSSISQIISPVHHRAVTKSSPSRKRKHDEARHESTPSCSHLHSHLHASVGKVYNSLASLPLSAPSPPSGFNKRVIAAPPHPNPNPYQPPPPPPPSYPHYQTVVTTHTVRTSRDLRHYHANRTARLHQRSNVRQLRTYASTLSQELERLKRDAVLPKPIHQTVPNTYTYTNVQARPPTHLADAPRTKRLKFD